MVYGPILAPVKGYGADEVSNCINTVGDFNYCGGLYSIVQYCTETL